MRTYGRNGYEVLWTEGITNTSCERLCLIIEARPSRRDQRSSECWISIFCCVRYQMWLALKADLLTLRYRVGCEWMGLLPRCADPPCPQNTSCFAICSITSFSSCNNHFAFSPLKCSEPERHAKYPRLSPWLPPSLDTFGLRLYAIFRRRPPVPGHSLKILSHLHSAVVRTSLLFVSEIFLVVNTVVVDKAVVLGRNLFSRSEAGARFRLADSGHGRLRRGRLWVLLLCHRVASIYPVEVDVYGLGKI